MGVSISADIERRLLGLSRLVGNTPLLALEFRFRGERRVIYAKAENLNMTGSIKDRMALHIIRRAYETGRLAPGDSIIEATSGNTGIAFAGIGRAMGHPVHIFMPDWMSVERINLIRAYGAEIHLVTREQGGFRGSIEMAEALAESIANGFLPSQFSNPHNVEAHGLGTGPEIWFQLEAHALRPDALVAGVGTGGTIMGAGRYLKHHLPTVKVHPLEPANSPTLSTGHRVGTHRIQGISDEFIPPIVDLAELDEVVSVDDGDAIIMARKLASEAGLGVGISSGANFLGALKIQNEMGANAVVVTVLPDDNKKYLSTDLLRDEPARDGFLSTNVQLLGFRAFNRVCNICFDAKEQTQTDPLGP
ncbi:MAG TPA: cysteine synthase family protein [Candidatus Krumholzibacteria bacterium]|nr:cysteine synthase family protein [Candidatus Krumholzibacteria bacterium]